jgi:hypothetical protein
MYCKYSREASEMYFILNRSFDIELCWNIEENMKKCKYFNKVSKIEWLGLQNKDDEIFLKEENLIA